MYLYIDETETDDYFIVVGLLMPSQEVTNLAFNRFKHSIKNYPIPNKYKCKLFVEFKSTLLDSKYLYIKKQMLKSINKSAIQILYSTYKKVDKNFKQGMKEKLYLRFVENMLRMLTTYKNLNIIFDSFGIKTFDSQIINRISIFPNVYSIIGKDSQTNHGLQFVDNLCGTIRLMITKKDTCNNFSIIENKVKSVDNFL